MFNKILVAVDSSALSDKVFEEAISLAKITSSHVILLQVISPYDNSYVSLVGVSYPNLHYLHSENVDYYMRALNRLKEEGLKYLQKLCQKALELGLNVEFTQNTGDPGRTICEIARSSDADLIMMGRNGHSALGEFFLGSVSNYVLHHAPCSVLVVQGQTLVENPESQKVEVSSSK